MTSEIINPSILKNMFIAGAKYLETKKERVNELNVFPVPDGDTGTNMTLTILSAAKEVEKIQEDSMAPIAKAISSGSLRGARGNSGVILSQLLRGFSKEIGKSESLDTVILASAMNKGVETAYKAVMKPKEGTILTVAKGMADKASELAVDTEDIEVFIEEVIRYGYEVLAQTPDMLPVLKEAGVVDAGGQGLLYVIEGAYKVLVSGQEVHFDLDETTGDKVVEEEVQVNVKEQDIKYGYCTEFIIDTGDKYSLEENEANADSLKSYLSTIGDSIVSVADEDLIKIHVHTDDPGLAMQRGLSFGQLSKIKVDNMRIQHTERVIHNVDQAIEQEETKELAPYGFVAVSAGEGIEEIFKSLNVDYVVTGGQTMNPSTEDFVEAVAKVYAKDVFILPNNKNIIMAASQVNELVEDKTIHVIESKTIPQGITALISFDPELSPEDNMATMKEAMSDVKTGQVTFAVRDTSIDSKPIKEGDILGLGDDGIISVSTDVAQTTKELVEGLVDEDSELITLYYGEEIKEEEADEIASYLEDTYKDAEVEIHYGGQPLYYYIVSVE